MTPSDDNTNNDADDRLSDCEENLVQITKAPTTTTLQDYGEVTIKNVCLRFGIDMEAALEEWGDFKQFFSDHQRNLKLRDVTNSLHSNETQ